jgi:diguanylate cyclase (GGDEF)-like protein
MKLFTRQGLLMNALLGGIVAAQLWQRRKLRRIARPLNYEGRLMHTAIRVTNEVRGSIDTPRMLETTVVEVARTLEIEHCCIRFDGDNSDNRKEGAVACSCGETAHDPVTGAAFTAALNALGDGRADRFLCHGHPNRFDSKNEPNTFPVLGLPINRDGDRLDGALLVLSHDAARVWLEGEMQLLLAVAHQLSLSVSHARLFAATEFNSLSDALTGCLNHRAFEMQFENHFRAAHEHKTPISLVMIDLDSFKDINDDYGHAMGNTALRTLAGILLQETVTGAIAARVGGDEFALIMPRCPLEQAVGAAERVRRCVEIPNNPDLDCRMTVSVGVASFPLHADSRESLYTAADKALYSAKNSGRNRVCVA